MNFKKDERQTKTENSRKLIEDSNELIYPSGNNSSLNEEDFTRSSSGLEPYFKTITKVEIETSAHINTVRSQKLTLEKSEENNSSKIYISLKEKYFKIESVKLGFEKLKNINPISRYNTYIEKYNEEINCYDNIKLRKIPLTKIISKILDLYVFWVRILFAVFLIPCSIIAHKFNFQNYKTYFQYYNIKRVPPTSSWNSENVNNNNNNWVYLVLSILSLILHIIIIMYCFWILYISTLIIWFLLIFSSFYVNSNNYKIKTNFYREMIFDEELDRTNNLNEYIIINPGNIEQYSRCSYYTLLVSLYRKRDMSVPQQFMIYSSLYKAEKEVIKNYIIKHLIGLLLLSFYYLITSLLNKI